MEYIIATLYLEKKDTSNRKIAQRSVAELRKNAKKNCHINSDEDASCDNRLTDSQSQSSTSPPTQTQDRFANMDRFMSIVGNISEMYGLFQQMRSEFRNLSNCITTPKASVKGIRNTRIRNRKVRSNHRTRKSNAIRKCSGTR